MSQSLFQPTFESLTQFECPDWFKNAKFGIWSHWGPQSVPMYGDWYARNMYVQDSPQYLYHVRKYGHPSEVGYKDVCALWKAENFEPDDLMKRYVRAGARYFVGQAMHHDHFFNFPSKYNRFNSAQMGPHKDICGMWRKSALEQSIPFGLSEHLGASFSWWNTNKDADRYGHLAGVPYDGNNPDYKDFYFDNATLCDKNAPPGTRKPWYIENETFRKYWRDVMSEVIKLYEPDLLYTDGALPFGSVKRISSPPIPVGTPPPSAVGAPEYEHGLHMVAELYNTSIKKYGENRAVYCQKDCRPEINKIGVLDIEKSQLTEISDSVWQVDTCIGGWFYDVRQKYKKPGHIIEMLVDIVSKNGNMLLNILQRPDGTLDPETIYILDELAKWTSVCGEGIFNTVPWEIYREGESGVVINVFQESEVPWMSSDIRYTSKDNKVYAFLMKAPEDRVVVLRSFKNKKINNVRLLGYGNVRYSHDFGTVTVQLPEVLPTVYTNCLVIDSTTTG